jgi:hypothetical protein
MRRRRRLNGRSPGLPSDKTWVMQPPAVLGDTHPDPLTSVPHRTGSYVSSRPQRLPVGAMPHPGANSAGVAGYVAFQPAEVGVVHHQVHQVQATGGDERLE